MSDRIFFIVDQDNISNNQFFLNKQESHHLINVLRKHIGTEIWLIDGIGCAYRSIVENIHEDVVRGQILDEFPKYGENNVKIVLGIGILKKDKMNLVVEKATELGVNKITPLQLDKCIKRDINLDRLVKISKTALKQCGRSSLPIIQKPKSLNESFLDNSKNTILVCHESGESGINIFPKVLKNVSKILLLIGPEGDFSKKEVELLKTHDAKFIELGSRRLRSETAVITALAQLNLFFK